MVSVFFRHERIRQGQKELMNDIIKAINEKKHLVAHAPTGLGKTDSSLSASLNYALENEKTIFFCTPKISQHKIAAEAMKGLTRKYDLKVKTLDIIGKKHLCLDSIREKETDGFYELCKKKKIRRSCYYYDRIRGYGLRQKATAKIRAEAMKDWYGSIRTHDELLSYCEKEQICPYESSLIIGEEADVIICDYYHILNPFIGDSFLSKTNKNLEDAIVIIDEAHNASERLRNALSSSLTISMIRKARNECILSGAKELDKRLQRIERELEKMAGEMGEEQERVMHKSELPLFSSDFFEELYEVGMFVLETTNLNRSYCLKLLSFYENWVNDSEAFIRIFKKTKKGYSAVVKCLDASIITGDRLNSTHSTILMSGTLKPGEMYRDLLGLDKNRTIIKEYSSPFPKRNKLNILVKGVTTKYENRTMEEFVRIGKMIREITNSIPGNSAVFFPSYSMMEKVMPFIKSDKKMIAQEKNQPPKKARETLENFKKLSEEGGGVLIGVSGGSFAEGIDLPGNDLLGVVVVGIPLKEPDIETRALIKYYDLKFGKGWDYGYILPAMSKVVQAAGRVIRNEEDKGVIVFLDTRFSWKKYAKSLPSGEDFVITENPSVEVKKFWLR